MKFYLDTSVWRDYFEDRTDGTRPLGEFAFGFLLKCEKEKHTILVTKEVTKELLAYYSEEKVKEVFLRFNKMIVEIEYNKKQVSEARNFWLKTNKEFPFSDILHSIIARDNDSLLISRDKHFDEIDIVECLMPEEV